MLIIQFFSLKRLQVIDLVTQSGIFHHKNISIPTSDFLQIINTFDKEDNSRVRNFYVWHNVYDTSVSEIITDIGLCNTINMANLSDVLHTDVVSRDFHYIHDRLSMFDMIDDFKKPYRTSTSNGGLDINLFLDGDYVKGQNLYAHIRLTSLVSFF